MVHYDASSIISQHHAHLPADLRSTGFYCLRKTVGKHHTVPIVCGLGMLVVGDELWAEGGEWSSLLSLLHVLGVGSDGHAAVEERQEVGREQRLSSNFPRTRSRLEHGELLGESSLPQVDPHWTIPWSH